MKFNCTAPSHHLRDIIAPNIKAFMNKRFGHREPLESEFEHVYALFLQASCYGAVHGMNDSEKDPFLATSIDNFRFRRNALHNRIKKTYRFRFHEHDPLPLSDHVKNVFFSGTYKEQIQILVTLEFEFRIYSIVDKHCKCCHTKSLFLPRGKLSVTNMRDPSKMCEKCKNRTSTKGMAFEQMEKELRTLNYLPYWIERFDHGVVKFNHCVPEVLQGFTLGEKFLVQRYSTIIPAVNISSGRLGIKGHTCSFKQDLVDVANDLPRKKANLIYLIRMYQNGKNVSDYERQIFLIRKTKVITGLRWMKENHTCYKDINIVEENLAWMGDQEEANLPRENLRSFEETVEACIESDIIDPTVSQNQTLDQNEFMLSSGAVGNGGENNYSKENEDIASELRDASKNANVPILSFPQVMKEPIDEYKIGSLFANTYPWLFPGGFGDVSGDDSGKDFKEWSRILMQYEDGRFARDPMFSFHLHNFLERKSNASNATYFVSKFISTPNISLDEVKEQITRDDLSFVRKIQTYAAEKSRGTDSYWRNKKKELDSWMIHHLKAGHGAPTLFITLSCAEYWWNDLSKLLQQRLQGTEDHILADNMMSEDKTTRLNARKKLMDSHSIIVQEFFQIRVREWLETIGKKKFGIKFYYLRYEFTKGRGQIHVHLLAITEDWGLQEEFYNAWTKQGNKEEAASIVSSYAREQLDLTGEKLDFEGPGSSTFRNPLSNRFSETEDVKNDLAMLIENCHMHNCGEFCMRFMKK